MVDQVSNLREFFGGAQQGAVSERLSEAEFDRRFVQSIEIGRNVDHGSCTAG
jgi:hypothetical protein